MNFYMILFLLPKDVKKKLWDDMSRKRIWCVCVYMFMCTKLMWVWNKEDGWLRCFYKTIHHEYSKLVTDSMVYDFCDNTLWWGYNQFWCVGGNCEYSEYLYMEFKYTEYNKKGRKTTKNMKQILRRCKHKISYIYTWIYYFVWSVDDGSVHV